MQQIPLVCVPFAGAGASFFRPWGTLAGDGLKIVPLQPPGREWKLDEEPYRDAAQAATGLLPEVLDEIGDSGRVTLFGHSLGAVLAYELGHRLAATPGIEVVRLIVSGSPGPWSARPDRASGLADDDFLRRVEEFAGYSHEALANPEMRELVLPVLRADVEMHENYLPADDRPLPAPITAVRGRTDELVTTEQAEEWSKATSREFTLTEVDGGHMYLAQSAAPLLRLIADHVTRG
ncbi:thioesterase II family protein [Streptomyces sp. NPDC015032]|uniref:thioesterase II family protein n=1 Tax=Streptomyces sp. NPDC015032 TaxID=3364937 RepID=UPI0036F58659